MSERLIRLIRILILIQNQPGIAAKELAETCEVTERTIYRDLQLLQVSNIPITNLGYGKGYEFIGDFSIYPLNWTEEEAMAFQLLPNVLTQVNHLIPPAFYEGYEKLMGAHLKEKKNTKQMLKQLTSIIQMGKPVYQQGNNDFFVRHYPSNDGTVYDKNDLSYTK